MPVLLLLLALVGGCGDDARFRRASHETVILVATFSALSPSNPITAGPACDVDKDCGKCLPIDAPVVVDGRIADAGVDGPDTPSDAVVDSVIIII